MTRTDPEQPCPESLCLVTWSLQTTAVAMSVLYWVKTGPSGCGRLWTAMVMKEMQEKEETEAANLQRKFILGGRHLVMKLSRASDRCVSRIISQ